MKAADMSSPNFFDNQPLRYYKGRAIYLAYYLSAGLAVGCLLMLLLVAARFDPIYLIFIPSLFVHGYLWQPLTYVFVNDLSFFTPLGILCVAAWGVEVEKYLGRRRFAAICGALVAGPALYSLVLYFLGAGLSAAGMFFLTSGLLVAFATLYPDLEYFGWFPLKWFAAICIGCGSVTYFPGRNWFGLGMLWLNCFIGYASIQYARGHFSLPRWRLPSFRPKPKFRVVRGAETSASGRATDETASEVDVLLDKIAKSGLQSLTAAERSRLEKARQEMLKRGP
jgi:hypothetical protein